MTDVEVREGTGLRPGVPQPREQAKLLMPGEWERLHAVQASSGFLLPVGVHWVERDVLGIAQEVSRRWPNLRIASCNCGRCVEEGHHPHVVMELTRSGKTVPVFGFMRFGRHVIERLWAIHADQNPNAAAMEHNARQRRALKKKSQEVQAENLEVVEAALNSRKHDWKGPKGLKTNPHMPSSKVADRLGLKVVDRPVRSKTRR